ncbi:MAG: hypothetical protein ACAH83_09710 [Alphaproteobacteria bacterium]
MTTPTEKEFHRQESQRVCDKANALIKQVKEEILATAWREAPSPEQVQKPEFLDMAIGTYLVKYFNPQVKTALKVQLEGALFMIQSTAETSKPGAQISEDEVKAILHKHAAAGPRS